MFHPDADQGTVLYQHQDHYDGAEFYDQTQAIQGEHFDGTQYGAMGQAEYVAWGVEGIAQISEPGYYYPLPHLTPAIYSAPVSALAYDPRSAAIYVASHTQPFGNRPRKASMLVTHNTLDGTLYSSSAGHPEAEVETLQSIYKTFYYGHSQATTKQARPQHMVPPHAYQPAFGATGGQQLQGAHMGITTLLSITPGFVTSVSPAGVRVHTIGGLCVSDNDITGMVCGTPHPEVGSTHVSVGGLKSQIHCLDIYQDLRIVSSHTFPGDLGVMALDRNELKRALVAGCSDGTLRLLDGRMRGAEVAKIKSHAGGVSSVATSYDGTLVATTGFTGKSGSASTNMGPYAFPDPNLLIYDIRYLGRGGIVHFFSGLKSSPRFVSFLPDMPDQPNNRFLVASGQPNGGLQILTPFEDTTENQSNFIFPLVDQGVSITCMTLSEQRVALGTSQGNVLRFELAGYIKDRTQGPINLPVDAPAFPTARGAKFTSPSHTIRDIPPEGKIPLVMPSSFAASPSVLINPAVLQSTQLGGRCTAFSSFIMCGNPVVSKVGSRDESTFGPMACKPMIPSPKRTVAETILRAGSRKDGDGGQIIATAAVDVSLHPKTTSMLRKGRKPCALRENPNKFIFSERLSSSCYVPDSRRKGRTGKLSSSVSSALAKIDGVVDNTKRPVVPDRYRLTLRPQRVTTEHFKHSKHNASGLWPGWDYPPSMPNAHVPAVLVLLYFEPEVRTAMLERQSDKRLYSSKTVEQVPPLSTELGFLYHYMESISHNAMVHPGDEVDPQIGVFTPVNFLAAFASMPEAANLALLDDNPAVTVKAQRPEAFYRFLLHHLDKEAGSKKSPKRPFDSAHGISFICSNEFVSGNGRPTVSKSRALTLDLSYNVPVDEKESKVRFGEILRHSLRRETKLRAWNNTTQTYETVVQRKVATSLPDILSISCACAGRQEGEGLSMWRTSFRDHNLWLPEMVEIELDEGDDVVVRELVDSGELEEKWITFDAKSPMTSKMTTLPVKDRLSKNVKVRYRLESVLSFIRDDSDGSADKEGKPEGHHVLHVRVPSELRKQTLSKQLEHVEDLSNLLQQEGGKGNYEFTLTSNLTRAVIASRIERLKRGLQLMPNQSEWLLFNGYVVTPTSVQDARSFHVDFREPCILVYRSIAENARADPRANAKHLALNCQEIVSVMQSKSLSSGHHSKYAIKDIGDLPGEGDIVALDAEFVSVQEEKNFIGDSGDKIVFNETRHALARVSVVDCRSNSVLIDDHVLPKEPVVDCLTRFSGILPGDLDPKISSHHLVPARTAYLKLRSLLERRCIFLGHGLSTDFLTANLFVPPHQIIDTVELYHKDRHRFISLRFLANYVLGRDTQQDVHDSVEDAMTANELFQRAKELMANGSFPRFLDELYENGQRVNWKLGIDGQPRNSRKNRSD